ncbi:GGDEF domain-containing protein [Marinobacterium jannaschii]|uniref:GGDEF domain-containing protein n=1 Tax=Marinobacterium jannaschii TaxID=64970 RepID=UPI000561EF38|nr:GGDEF domain-containing protein [Marinobacterium jannaschii]
MSEGQGLTRDRLQTLLGTMEQSVFYIGSEGEIESCSPGAAGWMNADYIQGKRLDELFNADLVKQLYAMLDRVRTSGQSETIETQLRPIQLPELKAAGLAEAIWVKMTLGGNLSESVLLMQDITVQKRLSRKVTSQAQRDPLTGAFNRRSLVPVLGQAMAQAQRYDWVCSLMLIDIDHFKAINDEHGWDAGDQILQQLVTSLHALKRTADFLARFGDDELAIFLPETNQEQALLAANRVLQAVHALEIPYQTGDLKFTVSVGISTLEGPEDSVTSMIKRAEENLFIARQSGGDRAEGDSSA